MRRKSERTATKNAKSSPEKKVEKVKRTRTRRRKQSMSSENESEEGSPVRQVEAVDEPVKEAPTTPVKEASPEEQQDQVWQVKTAEASDGGEIQKLKICLTRPPSTPERADRSPRSRRKHSRATSSSDTPSSEGVDDKKRSRRSKRNRESKDESEKNNDSQGDEPDAESENISKVTNEPEDKISQSTGHAEKSVQEDTPVSTTTEEAKNNEPDTQTQERKGNEPDTQTNENSGQEPKTQDKSDADSTVASPKSENNEANTPQKQSPERRRSDSVEKSEVLEIHAEADDSRIETSETQLIPQEDSKKDEADNSRDQEVAVKEKVSINQDKSVSEEKRSTKNDKYKTTNNTDVVESSVNLEKKKPRKISNDSDRDKYANDSVDKYRSRDLEHADSTPSAQEENINNGPATPFVVNRKRKWGARPKLTTRKSITISTDVLKEIIPDVKPVEFEEVIEDKKYKRIEVTEKIERPVLPKIIIDNTENVVRLDEDMDSKENIKRETNLAANRRISIVKENDSILARPPSPPRHKQSNILYITNLVRPFTLPQLKNLLQRTGRIAENGFWIDRIKSKCFVQYENEDQAVETRHALHGVTWPVSNPKALQVDFSTREAFDKARLNEENDTAPVSSIPGTVEGWLREQDMKRDRGELEKPWERKAAMREWDLGKNDKEKEGIKDRLRRDDRILDKRRVRSQDRSPEPARKFKKKEEEAPAKLLDDLFRKTKTTPCIYWLPLSAETIAIKEEQRRKHMEEHERRLQELRRHRERDRRH